MTIHLENIIKEAIEKSDDMELSTTQQNLLRAIFVELGSEIANDVTEGLALALHELGRVASWIDENSGQLNVYSVSYLQNALRSGVDAVNEVLEDYGTGKDENKVP